jgi:lipid-binding SYLF domain-containing protein
MKMDKRRFLTLAAGTALVGVTTACSTTSPDKDPDPASRRRTINAKVDEALTNLYAQAAGSRELAAKAKGVLVFPSVVSAGFMVGGSYGEGALRKGGMTTGYYSTGGASVGLLAGAQAKAVYLLFMNDEALAKFEASKGWTAGVDASVAVADAGASASVDTATGQKPIMGYVLVTGGLMANLSFDGTKFTKLDL